jgi:hypothetical protein
MANNVIHAVKTSRTLYFNIILTKLETYICIKENISVLLPHCSIIIYILQIQDLIKQLFEIT